MIVVIPCLITWGPVEFMSVLENTFSGDRWSNKIFYELDNCPFANLWRGEVKWKLYLTVNDISVIYVTVYYM